MANLTINDPPVFTKKIYKIKEEDYITAELENGIKEKLLNNDVFLKELIEENEQARLYSKELEEADLLTVQENGVYFVKHAQNVPTSEAAGYFKVFNNPSKLEGNRRIDWYPCLSARGGTLMYWQMASGLVGSR